MPEPQRLIQLFIATIIGVALIATLASTGFTTGTTAVHADTTSYTTISHSVRGIPSNVDVTATTGNALAFDGNTTIHSNAPQNLTQGSWTVCASPELNTSANQNATYDIFAYQNESLLIQYDAGSWSAYYNNTTHSANATIPAPNPSSGLTQVCSRYNHTSNELTIVREQTYSSPQPLTPGITPRNVSLNWTGRIDEIKTHNTAVANQTINEYADDPIRPQPGTNRSSRFMLDEGQGSTTNVYFADTDATITNPAWTSGIPAAVIPEDPLLGPRNYVLQSSPFSIRLASGGYLEGAPVVYVSWNGNPLGIDWMEIIAALLFTLIIATIANELNDHL